MKKAIAIIVLVVFVFSAYAVSFAETVVIASLENIKYSENGSEDKVTIFSTNYKGYKVAWLKNPDRLVIDIPNNKVTIKGRQTLAVNGQYIKSIRFSQFTKTAVRIVFDTKGKVPYSVSSASGSLTFTLGKASTVSRGDTEERPAPPAQQLSILSANDGDRIIIPGSNHDGYNTFRLTDPDRVVIDVPNLMLSADQELINANGKYVSTVRSSPVDSTTTRVVMDTKGQPQYRLEKTSDSLIVILEEPAVKNVSYHNNGDGIFLFLDVAKLTEAAPPDPIFGSVDATAEEASNLKKLFSESYDQSGNRYTMTFPQSLANIGSGTLQINDGVIDSIEITNDAASETTSIIFNAKSRYKYQAITNLDTYTTEISILKPYDPKDRLVVIDAGHGGSDPGAQYDGLVEKDLNLKIAHMVNEILEAKGIKTYMTRDDDTFIPLHNRADIANNLNASLFLSIHNNAYNSSEQGTETLYYPGSTGKNYARIVQDTLVNALGTKDRGIVERPNLVVLNATKMPSVIAEVAFLTNSEDRARLMDDSFLRKAAEALAEAVVKALG